MPACAADLDALHVPIDLCANAAQKLLRAANECGKRAIVLDAVAWRRQTTT